MALSTTTMRMPPYAGNGTASEFSVDFYFREGTDFLVIIVDTETLLPEPLDEGDDYEAEGAGDPEGGLIRLLDDGQAWLDEDGYLKDGYELHILRKTPRTQGTTITSQGTTFNPATHESAWNKITMMIQELQDAVDRAQKLPAHITPDLFNPDLPIDIVNAGALIPITTPDGDAWDLAENWIPKGQMEAAIAAGTAAPVSAAAASDSAAAAAAALAAAEAAQAAAEAAQAAAEAAAAGAAGTSIQEGPASGAENGVNDTFTTSETPTASGPFRVYLRGRKMTLGVGFSRVGDTVTMLNGNLPEEAGDLEFDYLY